MSIEDIRISIAEKAKAIYITHHGDNVRADLFAAEVLDRSEIYDEARPLFMPNPQLRRKYCNDLKALLPTVGKLRSLLSKTGIECKFPLRDGSEIRYPDILNYLEKQVQAEIDALPQSRRTGSKRHDIEALASQLAAAFYLFDLKPEKMMPLLELITDADTKTLQAYLKPYQR